jgi:hypothetical protein
MHRCVCIWWYILQNYNYKLHFQNLSIYHIPHVSIGTLAAENLDVCTACDPWDSNIQLTMVKDRRPGLGMPFLDSDTCAEGGLFSSARVFFPMPSMDGWWDRWMDGKNFTTTTSFTICNNNSTRTSVCPFVPPLTWLIAPLTLEMPHLQSVQDDCCNSFSPALWPIFWPCLSLPRQRYCV